MLKASLGLYFVDFYCVEMTELFMKAPADFANLADDSEKTIGRLCKHIFIDLKTAI
ncbi:hypothetical protein QWT87_07950 [Chryseobacterium sp. APV1]|uniref:Uncharacterized protein n=1 Tax=Chryseobacterium urinae TaxID=3058400 RepID=A0ABT8U2Z3_9FLAO|nr:MULTISPECIES: hypothetical protein [Chryseobacterium]MDO3424821.1 hypothetical protein [Chryseobacterium sp. APV1]